jgi:transcriptional regulator with XRE-family HTH domain
MTKDKAAKAPRKPRKASIARTGSDNPNPVDIHVGSRLRMRRSMMGMSQESLADSVGLTFQQVQKYERGSNRVSASRLYQFSKILDVPVAYFFDRYGEGDKKSGILSYGMADNDQEQILSDDILMERETHEILRVYYSIKDEKKRREILHIVKSMANNLIG